MAERCLNLYSAFSFTADFFALPEDERRAVRKTIADDAERLSEATSFYSAFPSRTDVDFMIWSAWSADEKSAIYDAFTRYGDEAAVWRHWVQPTQSLWGLTRVSTYARGKSAQDLDPFVGPREPYFVAYPFSKNKDWYLMSMDARQGQMNEHIKLGKQYPEIKQLLLYSFGLQDHEFIVAYEMADLAQFSELVYALRSTEARRSTLLDSPVITGFLRTREQFVK